MVCVCMGGCGGLGTERHTYNVPTQQHKTTRQQQGGTAFLDDATDAVTETFNPPPPSNWWVFCVCVCVCVLCVYMCMYICVCVCLRSPTPWTPRPTQNQTPPTNNAPHIPNTPKT